MKRVNKDKILRIWSLLIYTKGRSKYNKEIPILLVFSGSNNGNSKTELYGEYSYSENVIKVWCGPHTDFADITSTIIHEYTHYLQFWPWYTRYRKMYSYEKNPYEIEAKKAEKYSSDLLEGISKDYWEFLLKENNRLKRIYEKSQSNVTINY